MRSRARLRALAAWELAAEASVDIASLAFFRAAFGALMFVATLRFVLAGWVHELYIAPSYFVPYDGLEWIRPWPGPWMYVHFAVVGLAALGVAFGAWYRLSSVVLFVGFTWVELFDRTNYLNHYYLISLLSGLLTVLPAHRAWSVDARRDPSIRLDVTPAWTLSVLRFQVAIVYVFAGLAKLEYDWLVRAQPLKIWLAARSDLPLIGPLLEQRWTAYAMSWAGAAYDLSIVPLLCMRRTRRLAFVAVVVFHLLTRVLFDIGMFPWVMIVAATLFFAPSWPRRWLRFTQPVANAPIQKVPRAVTLALAAFAAVQLALPLRAYFVGDSAWSCRGFDFAWRVMLAEKAGSVEFRVRDPESGREWEAPLSRYLTPRQAAMTARDPWMIRTVAKHIARDFSHAGGAPVQVRVDAYATLNGRPGQWMIRRDVDLASALPDDWIVPLAR